MLETYRYRAYKALEYRSKAYRRRGESKNFHDTRKLLNILKANPHALTAPR